MSLPPGFLEELRSRTSIAHVAGRKVTWDMRKSQQGKGDMWAPCPFHQEKTASFHVDDRKGFYYCFGCHQKGDAISFVQETENVGFMEAVEILAREAGMQMPARDPKAQEKADRITQLAEVMEQAARHFRLQLKMSAGAEAREYLRDRRGLSDAALDRWEIGFAPPGWSHLWEHLTGKGVAPDLILGAGLARASDKGREPYDTFRNRIMFPIRDARGRCIAFGGRAMDPNDNAKYLNSPETELFDKGRSLYNHGPAREAAGKGVPLLVAEGYMDVIALAEAGFGATVAPLGTAITEDQLALLWRIHPEPIVALDGDKAGLGAALRLIDLALPRLTAGNALRFALMPEGQDPDDVIRAGGRAAMEKVVAGAVPMVELLWRRETDGKVFDSPERRATLDKALRERIRTIRDPSIRRHYGEEIAALRRALFRPQAGGAPQSRGSWRPRGAPQTATAVTRGSLLASGDATVEDRLQEAVVLATLLAHPSLLETFASELERLESAIPAHERIRIALLAAGDATDPEKTREKLDPADLEKLYEPRHVRLAPGVRDTADSDRAALGIAEALARLSASRGARRDIEEAVQDMSDIADEGITWRLAQAAEARNRAGRSDDKERSDFDVADNGARLARDERDAFAAVLAQADPRKAGRKTRSSD